MISIIALTAIIGLIISQILIIFLVKRILFPKEKTFDKIKQFTFDKALKDTANQLELESEFERKIQNEIDTIADEPEDIVQKRFMDEYGSNFKLP